MKPEPQCTKSTGWLCGKIIMTLIIFQIYSLAGDWSKRVTWANISQLKLRIFPNFQNCARCEKDLKDNKHNSLHLGRKYARIFVLGQYLLTHSFPWSTLSENCLLLRTDNVRGRHVGEYSQLKLGNIRGYFRAKWRLLFIYSTRAREIIVKYFRYWRAFLFSRIIISDRFRKRNSQFIRSAHCTRPAVKISSKRNQSINSRLREIERNEARSNARQQRYAVTLYLVPYTVTKQINMFTYITIVTFKTVEESANDIDLSIVSVSTLDVHFGKM